MIWLRKCQGAKILALRFLLRSNTTENRQEVKRWRRVISIYPAVGMLIFASYPRLTPRTGSHLFDSPRPCPHSRLGSRPPKRRPITRSRVGHRTQSASPLGSSVCHVGVTIFASTSQVELVRRGYGWGDRALQECNLSTQLVRCLQVTQAPVPPCGIGFFLASANTAESEKLSVHFRRSR